MQITTRDGIVHRGRVLAVGEDALISLRDGPVPIERIAYSDVTDVRRAGMSKTKKIAIAAAAVRAWIPIAIGLCYSGLTCQ